MDFLETREISSACVAVCIRSLVTRARLTAMLVYYLRKLGVCLGTPGVDRCVTRCVQGMKN